MYGDVLINLKTHFKSGQISVPRHKFYRKFMKEFRQENKVEKVFQYHQFVRSSGVSLETYFPIRNWQIIAFLAQMMAEGY